MRLGTVFREVLGMGKKLTEFFWSGILECRVN